MSQLPSAGSAAARVTELRVTGMTCSNCARHATEALQGVAGVESVLVDLAASRAVLRWRAGDPPAVAEAIRAVKEAGFGAKVRQVEEGGADHASGWRLNLWVGTVGTVPLMLGEWLLGGEVVWFRWVSLVIAGIVQVVAGARFYRGAWNQLKRGASNMDTLVSIGSTTAFLFSTGCLITGQSGHLYFMEAAAIITIISVGHWLESRMSIQAASALRQLMELAPPRARRIAADGREQETPVGDLQPEDRVALKPGDRVPTDGVVIEGCSAVDESMLTGESVPVDKSTGSRLYAGTGNVQGRLVMRVTAIGEETALAHIIAAVQRAQSSRAEIQRLGDRVSNVFVPVVVTIAVLAGLWWGLAPASALAVHHWLAQFLWVAHPPATPLAAALIIGASVLIIACPCAMGLATPAAIMAAANAAARRGILVRDGLALEQAGRVTTVLFDKTGTLTVGKLEVGATLDLTTGRAGEPRLADLAASLASHSTHPMSQAVARLSERTVEMTDWKEVPGAGVQGRVAGENETLRLGSLGWLEENGVDLTPGRAFAAEWSVQCASLIGLAEGVRLLGLVAIKDALKPGAKAVVDRLQAQGLKVWLVTGDNAATAAAIGGQAGIAAEQIVAQARPEAKAELVQRLQRQGERVAFAGDGINDAPALEQADLGIAVSRASDVAREAADLILLRSDLEAVPEAIDLARATLRTIKQNLFWAFFYNAASIPLAALGFMSPILCAVTMGFSDVVVIGNALRLRSRGPQG